MAKEKFEEALDKLENIVKEMEAGDLPLDAALKSFEEGIRLIRFCSAK
ncbi:MAG TPA: exodeoxyribonuclease VII small subunit, partial [Smithellaceae bacterium]|nr:exodeoxyribonuclease VII small subunit [Smithellaceae bacterium]